MSKLLAGGDMMKRILFFGLVAVLCLSTLVFRGLPKAWGGDASEGRYKVTKLWETSKELRIPESVVYDETRKILYVSNINGKSGEKDGQGFISKVSLDGKIKALKWVTGLNAPKGSAIYQDKLYVSDIDHVVEIDLNTGTILANHPAPGAQFLNDAAADAAGNIYVSDMSPENSAIYQLSHGRMSVWMKGPEISRPNGLAIEGTRLLVGNSGDGALKAINLADKDINTIAHVGSGIDGLRPDGKGNYIISDWQGKTSLVTESGKIIVLIDTTDAKINAADLEYIPGKRLLLIPTFFDNRIMAHMVEETP
jgi:sugar lactone lactonase YvrE